MNRLAVVGVPIPMQGIPKGEYVGIVTHVYDTSTDALAQVDVICLMDGQTPFKLTSLSPAVDPNNPQLGEYVST